MMNIKLVSLVLYGISAVAAQHVRANYLHPIAMYDNKNNLRRLADRNVPGGKDIEANHRHLRTNPNNAAFELLDQLEYQYSNPRPVALKGEEEAKKIHLSRFLKKTETANEDDGEEEEEDTNGGKKKKSQGR